MANWKVIENFENYEVSDDGQVRNRKTGLVLKPQRKNNGYYFCNLYVNGKMESKTIHRLVALAFIPNPEKKPQVNHIDEDKTKNSVINLEWMTARENNNWGTRTERSSKPIIVIYRDNTFEEYPSATTASKELGLTNPSVVRVLKGRRKTHRGLKFQYIGENNHEQS